MITITRRAATWLCIYLSLAVIGVSVLTLAGYVRGQEALYRWFGQQTPMAAQTAACLLALAIVGFFLSQMERYRLNQERRDGK